MPASGAVLGVFFRKLRCAVSGETIREGEATLALCHTRELRESALSWCRHNFDLVVEYFRAWHRKDLCLND